MERTEVCWVEGKMIMGNTIQQEQESFMGNPWIPTKQLDPDMPESVFAFNKTENSGTTSKEAN